jgi:hypothetical protein
MKLSEADDLKKVREHLVFTRASLAGEALRCIQVAGDFNRAADRIGYFQDLIEKVDRAIADAGRVEFGN